MPLHLAHHKSYHPYSRNNIERVKRDEEEAQRSRNATEEHAQAQKANARIHTLRTRQQLQDQSRESLAGDNNEVRSEVGKSHQKELPQAYQHINLWSAKETRGLQSQRTSHRKDLRGNRERHHSQDPVGVYLDSVGRDGHAWYDDVKSQCSRDRRKTQEQKLENACKDNIRKSSHDPLRAMSSFLAQREAARRKKQPTETATPPDFVVEGSISSYKHYVDPTGNAAPFQRGQDFCERPGNHDPGGRTADTISDPQTLTSVVNGTVTKAESDICEKRSPTRPHLTTEPPTIALPRKKIGTDIESGAIGISTETVTTDTVDEQPAVSRSASFAGESVYPALLGEMIDTVLKDEAYLFDDTELGVVRRYTSIPYEARYLFARLIQRKDSWLRLDALRDRYASEITDIDDAVACLLEPAPFLITHADIGDEGREAMLNLLTLEELKSLAKRMNTAKVGTTKASIIAALLATKSQGTLTSMFAPASLSKPKSHALSSPKPSKLQQLSMNFNMHGKKASQSVRLASEVTTLLGFLVRVAPSIRSLIDRVALVFYRGTMLGGTALTTAILARSRRRNYPAYQTQRSPRVFPSREHLLAFEEAIGVENEMEELLQRGDNTEATFNKALKLFDSVWPVWKDTVASFDDDDSPSGFSHTAYHRMRFHAGWSQTRVVYKGTAILARFKLHDREKEVLRALLGQRYFRRGKRGEWYDRLALITALYAYGDNKIEGKLEALKIAIAGIEDPDTHLIYHDQLQRRICRLEDQLPIPKSQKHDFTYAKLKECQEQIFHGTRLDSMDDGSDVQSLLAPLGPSKTASPQSGESPAGSKFHCRVPLRKAIKIERQRSPVKAQTQSVSGNTSPVKSSLLQRSPSSSISLLIPSPQRQDSNDGICSPSVDVEGLDQALLAQYQVARKEKRTSMHSIWRGLDGAPCRVEEYVLQQYALRGYVGLHDEGGLLKMLFALCMWDIIFASGTIEGGSDGTGAVEVFDVFETPYQRAPLDMDQDSFAVTRGPIIRSRLALISAGGAPALVRDVDNRERPRKTWAIGCRWDSFSKEQLIEVATLIPGTSLAIVFQMMTEEWGHCSGGMPDLIIWRPCAGENGGALKPAPRRDEGPDVKLCEVKGPGDRLSETQKVWIDVLCRAGIQVEVSLVREAEDSSGVGEASSGRTEGPTSSRKRARSQSQSTVKKGSVAVTKCET